MAYETTYNEISDKLKSLIPKIKGDEQIIFRLKATNTVEVVGADNSKQRQVVYPKSQNIPSTDRIFDPFKGEDGEYVDIALITGVSPGTRDGKAPLPNFGSPEFDDKGHIIISRSTPKSEAWIQYLCLTNRNEDSVNPRKEAPKRGFMFEQVKPAEDAKTLYERKTNVLQAQTYILEAQGEHLTIMRENCGIPSIEGNVVLSEFEIKNRLSQIAEQDPMRIIKMSSDEAGQLRVLIRNGVKAKVIEFDEDSNEWRLGDSKEKITGIKPGAHPEDSLLSFLQNNSNSDAYIKKLQNSNNKRK